MFLGFINQLRNIYIYIAEGGHIVNGDMLGNFCDARFVKDLLLLVGPSGSTFTLGQPDFPPKADPKNGEIPRIGILGGPVPINSVGK